MKKSVLLIGASTGGPSQIKKLLSHITTLARTIIIVQHMQEEILPYYIKDLQESFDINIQTTPLKTLFSEPSVIICSKSSILRKNFGSYEIITSKENQMYTPDINILFNSFVTYANDFDLKVLIMTGIGRDGVDGAINLKRRGALIYAQDELSSPVFGMPKAAIESGIVDKIKSLNQIQECFKDL